MARYRTRLFMAGVFALGVAVGALGLTVLQRGAGPPAHAQSAACTNATFSGTYGVLGQGYLPAGTSGVSSAAPVQVTSVLVVTADGTGGITIGGFMNPNPPMGTYTVNPDCSFTVTIATPNGLNIGPGSSAALGVLVNGGKGFYVASPDPNKPQYFIGERQ